MRWIRLSWVVVSRVSLLRVRFRRSVSVTPGVPKDSVLRQSLFHANINDLASQVRLFADNTAIYLTTKI